MTDKLNNLVETNFPEIGGYYRAGSCSFWDDGLTCGKLYLIHTMFPGDTARNPLLAVTDDDGDDECYIASSAAQTMNGGKFFKNPSNN